MIRTIRFMFVYAVVMATAQSVQSARAQADGPVKKLIEFGWDEPDTAFLRRHVAKMEETPFDGCVFHVMTNAPAGGSAENFTWLVWGQRAFTEAELQASREDLKALETKRFTHNFLRFNTTPAKIDWFDDFAAVVTNARLAATLAREGKCAGILFDVEEYEGPLFTYPKQRDAQSKPWDQYAAQARLRGREVMAAFQQGYPDLTVLLTFGHSLPRVLSEREKKTIAECDYGLLAPFLDGMVEAAQGKAKIVDGFELSYSFKDPANFDRDYQLMKEGVLPIVADPAKYKQFASAGFGIWLDYDWRNRGWNETDPSKNYFTPEGFEASVRRALERSDEFVWIYSETPRWWTEAGGTTKLPAPYDAAIRSARKGIGKD